MWRFSRHDFNSSKTSSLGTLFRLPAQRQRFVANDINKGKKIELKLSNLSGERADVGRAPELVRQQHVNDDDHEAAVAEAVAEAGRVEAVGAPHARLRPRSSAERRRYEKRYDSRRTNAHTNLRHG